MKVLVVDDHAVVREGVRRLLLAIEGVEIIEAETAHEGLALFRREAPDIVVLDVDLKSSSGIELLRRFPDRERGGAGGDLQHVFRCRLCHLGPPRRGDRLCQQERAGGGGVAECGNGRRGASPMSTAKRRASSPRRPCRPEESLKDLTPRGPDSAPPRRRQEPLRHRRDPRHRLQDGRQHLQQAQGEAGARAHRRGPDPPGRRKSHPQTGAG